ncbi:MAG: hypothetical protein DMG67_00200 [Acidobacteria bacterium]|nr:MAG: hypothetical protein DMG67_00200 [Acidobacteriota bacterium]
MTKLSAQLLAILLLTTTATTLVAAQDASPMLAAHSRSDCHQHDTTPVPQPVSYRCCQSGHDSAILQNSLTSELGTMALLPAARSNQNLPVASAEHSPLNLAVSSPDPPDLIALRI